MINAQKWLDKNYPKEKRSEITELDISNQNLEGELDLVDFTNLEKVNVESNFSLEELKNKRKQAIIITSKSQLVNLVNAKEWLEQNYPKGTRKNILELNINNKSLFGKLDLSDFSNLKKLDCKLNFLTSLKFGNQQKIREINCSLNQINELDFSGSDPKELINLNLRNNDFSSQDLSFFSKFINLSELNISNYSGNAFKFYNRFCGSLEPLSKLSKLKKLDISNTEIDSGLEFLPKSVEEIMVNNDKYSGGKKSKVKRIQKILEPYQEFVGSYEEGYYECEYIYYDYQAWRENNMDLIERTEINQLEQQLSDLQVQEQKSQIETVSKSNLSPSAKPFYLGKK